MGRHLRDTVVIGGGKVAARKVAGLLEAEAGVTVISPKLTPELQELAEKGAITHVRRAYKRGDLAGRRLVIAATNEAAVNEAVWEEAEERGCLVNAVDDAKHSNFTLPAVVRRGELKIAISTGGASPALARRLRERLEELIGTAYEALTEILAELRPEMKAAFPSEAARLEAALRIVDSDILGVIERDGREAGLVYARGRLQHAK